MKFFHFTFFYLIILIKQYCIDGGKNVQRFIGPINDSKMIITPSLIMPSISSLKANAIDSAVTIKMPIVLDFSTINSNYFQSNLIKSMLMDTAGSIMQSSHVNARYNFYKTMERLIGKSCLQRAICEVAQSPFIDPNSGLFGEILDLLLT